MTEKYKRYKRLFDLWLIYCYFTPVLIITGLIIYKKERRVRIMVKILEDLKLTVIAGIVLTVIMVFATNAIYDAQMSAPEEAVSDMMNNM